MTKYFKIGKNLQTPLPLNLILDTTGLLLKLQTKTISLHNGISTAKMWICPKEMDTSNSNNWKEFRHNIS